MANEKYGKFGIASNQLEAAIGMFVGGRDRFSVITLAGAADAIFMALVLKAGKVPFVDYARKVQEVHSGVTPSRGKYATHINNALSINALKHMDPEDDDFVELDVEQCAIGAILKAVVNYKELVGHEPDFIKAFLAWTWQNLDGRKIIENYENRSAKLR